MRGRCAQRADFSAHLRKTPCRLVMGVVTEPRMFTSVARMRATRNGPGQRNGCCSSVAELIEVIPVHRSVAAHAGVIALAIVVVLWDAIAAQTLPGAPGVPSVSVNDNTVTVAWAAPTTGAAPSSFVIIAGATSGIGNIGTFNVGPSRSITTLVRDGTYFIRVAGVNGAGQGPGSAEVSFTVGGGVAPGAPGTPVATVNGSSVTLSWTAPTTGGVPAYYLLTAGTTSGGRDLGTYSVGALTNITATMPSGTYFVRAIATNASGESMPSGEVAFTIAGGRSSPGALDGTWQGTTSQGVAVWFIVSNGVITRLNVGGLFNNGDCLASTDAGVVVPISIGPFAHTRAPAAGTLSWSMTGTFTANTTAMGYATMTASPSSTLACSGMVTVAWSARNYGVGAPLLPRTPIGFGASVNRNVVNFTWAAPATGDPPINEYLVEVRRPEAWPGEFPVDTVFTFAKSSMPCSPMCSAFVSSLAGRNTPYVARVRARNSSGTSAPSNEFTFTIPELPGAPRNLAVSVTAGTASFIWSAPASGGPPVSYDLEIGTASGLSDVAVRSATMTSYSLELSAGNVLRESKGS